MRTLMAFGIGIAIMISWWANVMAPGLIILLSLQAIVVLLLGKFLRVALCFVGIMLCFNFMYQFNGMINDQWYGKEQFVAVMGFFSILEAIKWAIILFVRSNHKFETEDSSVPLLTQTIDLKDKDWRYTR